MTVNRPPSRSLATTACQLGQLTLVAAILAATTGAAVADFRVCNNTQSRVGISIGYHDGQGWVTEGWFNLRPNRCDVILKGDLTANFYYVHALDYDRGGAWGGTSFMCTREREYTIRGSENCLARGYDRTGFIEINTGKQRGWTVELNEAGQTRSLR